MEQVISLKETVGMHLLPGEDGIHRILGTAMALLNQCQNELDQNRRQIEALRKELIQLEKNSMTDVVTGLKNRLGFETAFRAELDRVKRRKSNGGVLLLIDMDNFKAINDTHGHQAGDACLKLVGVTLQKEIRQMDTAARLGGDEFVVILADSVSDSHLNRIQQLIWTLNNLTLDWNGASIRISASLGMKPYDRSHTAEEIYESADKDMYADKQRRRAQ